ncbi:MAG: hypothetical protein CFE36_13540 [Sphingomonadaceae bacterium PASS1]|nr:MAG: hypothetical protein CFE36_13540 [Sphingomonadaceae bacterium PASS1]
MSYSRELSTNKLKGVFLLDIAPVHHAAGMLVKGRRLNRLVERLDVARDLPLETAYAIQKSATGLWDDQVAGWKIGRLPASVSGPGSTPRFIGPIFSKSVRKLSGAISRVPVLNEGQNAVEAEFIVRLAKPLGKTQPIMNHDFWLEHIAAIHVGVELAGNGLDVCDQSISYIQIAAFGNNRGLLVGDRIPPHRYRWPLHVTTAIEGEIVGSLAVASPWNIVTTALGEAFEETKAFDTTFKAGHWVATGALTGIHPIACDQNAIVQFEGYDSIEMVTSDIRKWQDA